MKTQILKISIAILLLTGTAWAQDTSTTIVNKTPIDNIIAPWMQANKIPGVAVEIYDHGHPSSYYFGYANLSVKKKLTGNTIFELGAITQVFTSLLVAEQVNAGHAKLSDSITQYMPDAVYVPNNPAASKAAPFNQVTLENLATYTAGLPSELPSQIQNRGQYPDYFVKWQPDAAIGTQWAYSNLSIGLLGEALEGMAHQNFNQMYRDKLLKPMGMHPIGIAVPETYLRNYAKGYDRSGNPVKPMQTWAFPAADGMKASGHDMLLFLKAALQLPGTPAAIVKAMALTETSFVHLDDKNQGLAWSIYPNALSNQQALLTPSAMNLGPIAAQQLSGTAQQFDANALIEKTGATNSFGAFIALIPGQKSGVVILVNRDVPTSEVQRMGREILFEISK